MVPGDYVAVMIYTPAKLHHVGEGHGWFYVFWVREQSHWNS